jgi:hypothetical protein
VSPFDGFLDFFRVDPMPGNMADVVKIPIEAFQAIQHSYSIYDYCIYSKAAKPTRGSLPPPRDQTVVVEATIDPMDAAFAEERDPLKRARGNVDRRQGTLSSRCVLSYSCFRFGAN